MRMKEALYYIHTTDGYWLVLGRVFYVERFGYFGVSNDNGWTVTDLQTGRQITFECFDMCDALAEAFNVLLAIGPDVLAKARARHLQVPRLEAAA